MINQLCQDQVPSSVRGFPNVDIRLVLFFLWLMTWQAFLLVPPHAQQQEKHVPGQAQGGLGASDKAWLPGRAAAGGILLEGVSPTAGSQLTGPKGPMSYSLWCRLPCVGLTTPVWDWSQGIPNGTSVSLALNYFTNGAAATSLEILWALLALCRICF